LRLLYLLCNCLLHIPPDTCTQNRLYTTSSVDIAFDALNTFRCSQRRTRSVHILIKIYNVFKSCYFYLFIRQALSISNYLPCSHLSPLKPGGHVQPFLSDNPPFRHSKDCDTDFSCGLLSKIFYILCLA